MALDHPDKPPRTHIVRTYSAAGFTLNKAVYPSLLRMPRHQHGPASFSFVLQGAYTETYERKVRIGESSMLIFHPSGETHSIKFEDVQTCILSVEVPANRLEQLQQLSLLHDSARCFTGGEPASLARRLHCELNNPDAVSPLSVEGLILELLAEASRNIFRASGRAAPRWLNQAQELVRSRFAESLTLDEIAGAVGVHPVHLSRAFRQRLGCTVGEYIRKLRIEYASRHLLDMDAPLPEIAAAAGFSDQSHLTRIFKRHLRMTPAEYRNAARRQR